MKRFVVAISVFVLALACVPTIATAQDSHRFTVEELLNVRRVGDPQISPDGRRAWPS